MRQFILTRCCLRAVQRLNTFKKKMIKITLPFISPLGCSSIIVAVAEDFLGSGLQNECVLVLSNVRAGYVTKGWIWVDDLGIA